MMTPHHIFLYILVEEEKRCINVKTHPYWKKRARRSMSEPHSLTESLGGCGFYEFRIKGHLDDRWVDRFEGLTITLEENGDTVLTGPVVDQAALHGLLKKVRDLGMSLVSVNPLEPGQADGSDVNS
jgi:hypothetical protein